MSRIKAKSKQAPVVFQGNPGGAIAFAGYSEADSDLIAAACGCNNEGVPPSELAQFAAKVAEDPMLMQKLGDRVYELMIEDFSYQRERYWNYRGGLMR